MGRFRHACFPVNDLLSNDTLHASIGYRWGPLPSTCQVTTEHTTQSLGGRYKQRTAFYEAHHTRQRSTRF